MKKIYKLLTLFSLFAITSCQSTPAFSITDEDKTKPSSTNFEYEDYGSQGSENWDANKWYKNELKDLPLPDPAVLEDDGVFYVYGTTDRSAARTFDCYSTEDFNNFTLHSNIYVPSANSYTKESLFAPEVYKIEDKYYLYYSGKTAGAKSGINVLVSDSPTGPFIEYKGLDANGNSVDYTNTCMIFDTKSGKNLSILDQTLLVEDDGSLYMYYSVYDSGVMQYIVGFNMLDPVTPDLDTYKILLRPGELSPNTVATNLLYWEAMKNFKVAEGPNVIKSPVNGKYYLTYSVNHYPDRYYTVCYAVSDTPLGDYEKPYTKDGYWTNLFFGYAGGSGGTVFDQWEGFQSGTAHHFIFKAGNEYMIAYHTHKNRKDSTSGRVVAFDHVYFDKDGVPYTQGPSTSIQPVPEIVSGYKNVAPLASEVIVENVNNKEYINDEYVVEHYNLVQEADKEVILNKGNSYIKFKLDKKYKVGGIQVVNSAFFDKFIDNVEFIKLGNNKTIIDGSFDGDNYVNLEKDFIYPDSNFTFDFDDVETDEIVFGFKTGEASAQINEIKIFGRE